MFPHHPKPRSEWTIYEILDVCNFAALLGLVKFDVVE